VAFETAIELNPELGAGYNNLGYVLYLQENFEAAIEMYTEAIGREHDTSAAYTNLGNAWQKLDKTEKAVESWKRALEVDPSNERAQRYLDRFAGPVA
jgi:tetratricopeptide (TPR) repeat protein